MQLIKHMRSCEKQHQQDFYPPKYLVMLCMMQEQVTVIINFQLSLFKVRKHRVSFHFILCGHGNLSH